MYLRELRGGQVDTSPLCWGFPEQMGLQCRTRGLGSSGARQVKDPQDGCFLGVISRSTSRMNRRHSSSCQGRATHCTATGRPTLFFMACRGYRHQDGRDEVGPQSQETCAMLGRAGSRHGA